MSSKVLLIVNDGWGMADLGPGNYLEQANTPFFDDIWSRYPHAANQSSGNAVGIPEGSQGNSEVGHLHLGAGRVVWQMYELINREIKDRSFFGNSVLDEAFDHAKGHTLHLIGLCSDGGIHSHINHLFALLELAKQKGLSDVVIHFVADGRDVPEKSALGYIDQIQAKINELGIGRIVSVVGRYFAMDRDLNWGRTKNAYDLMVSGQGHKVESAQEAVNRAYERGDATDYYIEPSVIGDYQGAKDGDVVWFFNFRTDRPRQLTRALSDASFDGFDRVKFPYLQVYMMTRYDETFPNKYAFDEPVVESCLSKVLADKDLKQLKVCESDKKPHVTYFFNSQIETPFMGEDRVVVPSPKVPSYDQTPEMSAYEIRDKTVEALEKGEYNFILVNFANADLVGHSTNREAIIKAVEVVDICNREVINKALECGYTTILTSDHGNAEEKLYQDGSPKPSHTTNPVPVILISSDEDLQRVTLRNGGAIDVAPTVLELLGIDKPSDMTGVSLINRQ